MYKMTPKWIFLTQLAFGLFVYTVYGNVLPHSLEERVKRHELHSDGPWQGHLDKDSHDPGVESGVKQNTGDHEILGLIVSPEIFHKEQELEKHKPIVCHVLHDLGELHHEIQLKKQELKQHIDEVLHSLGNNLCELAIAKEDLDKKLIGHTLALKDRASKALLELKHNLSEKLQDFKHLLESAFLPKPSPKPEKTAPIDKHLPPIIPPLEHHHVDVQKHEEYVPSFHKEEVVPDLHKEFVGETKDAWYLKHIAESIAPPPSILKSKTSSNSFVSELENNEAGIDRRRHVSYEHEKEHVLDSIKPDTGIETLNSQSTQEAKLKLEGEATTVKQTNFEALNSIALEQSSVAESEKIVGSEISSTSSTTQL